jgi:hypothetical protein
MNLFPHLQNDETAHVSIRLNKDEEMSLRLYMHVADKFQNVAFPHGVRLFYRSMGWYRLNTSNTYRASEKLKLGLSIIRKWYREYDEARTQELRLLLIKARPELQVMSYTDGQYVIHNKELNAVQSVESAFKAAQDKAPATPNKLAALAQRFAR